MTMRVKMELGMETETRAGTGLCTYIELGAELEDERWNGSGDGEVTKGRLRQLETSTKLSQAVAGCAHPKNRVMCETARRHLAPMCETALRHLAPILGQVP